jgi:hypothetical protein
MRIKIGQLLRYIIFALMLAFIFFTYLQPEFIVDLANRFVFCYVN